MAGGAAFLCRCGNPSCPAASTLQCENGEGARFTECTGKKSTHLTLIDIEPHELGPETDMTSWTMDTLGGTSGNPYLAVGGATAKVFSTTITGSIDGVPTPGANANQQANNGSNTDDADGPYIGYSISQTVNGETATFDVLPATGYSLDVSHTDYDYPNNSTATGYTTFNVASIATFTETIYKKYRLPFAAERHSAGSHPSDLDASYQWQIDYYRSRLMLNSIQTGTGGPTTTNYYLDSQRTDAHLVGGRSSPLIQTIDSVEPCSLEGFDITSNYESVQIARGLVNGVFTTATPTDYKATLQFAVPDVDLIGCRDCERILDVTGTFETLAHPTEGIPFYDQFAEEWVTYDPEDIEFENPIPGPDPVLETVTFAMRLTQAGVAACGTYLCNWTGSEATVTASGGDFEYTGQTYYLDRVSPIWYILRNPAGIWELKKAGGGDCPTGSWSVRRDPNPHDLNHHGGAVPNAGTTLDLMAPYVDTFTNRTVSIVAGTRVEGDPDYYCDCGGRNCEGGGDVLAVLNYLGTPINITMYLNEYEPCQYTGSSGTLYLDTTYVGGRFITKLYDSAVGEDVVATFKLNCADTGGDILGTYTRTDTGGGTITLSITD